MRQPLASMNCPLATQLPVQLGPIYIVDLKLHRNLRVFCTPPFCQSNLDYGIATWIITRPPCSVKCFPSYQGIKFVKVMQTRWGYALHVPKASKYSGLLGGSCQPSYLHNFTGYMVIFYRPIILAFGPFRYFLVLVDAGGTHFEVSLLSSRNIVFAKVLTILIKFKTHHPDFPMKILRMDNAKGFRSQHFEDYCLATGIELTYSVPYEHLHNGLAKAFIKKIQLINQPLLIHVELSLHLWAHTVLQTTTPLRYRPTLLNDYSPLELLSS